MERGHEGGGTGCDKVIWGGSSLEGCGGLCEVCDERVLGVSRVMMM